MLHNFIFNISLFIYGIGLIFFIYLISFYELFHVIIQQLGYKKATIYETYDYIIVGSGTGGSTVALRLSEDPHVNVLLLEAGSHSSFLHNIPAVGPLLQRSNIDWSYQTTPQKHSCFGLNNNQSIWPMGRIFGGTANLNNMVYLRGHPKDFNLWYLENQEYNYDIDIYPYFKKSENLIDDYGSTNGLMDVDDLPFTTPLADAVLKAVNILGYSTQDLNRQIFSGFMKPQVNIKNGKRRKISDVIYEKKPRNLQVLTGAVVSEIIFDDYNTAIGVNFTHCCTEITVKAKHGIVLSAGVIGTPKLLMLSGIGPIKHLNSVGITVRKNLPVGMNLQDHIATGSDLFILNETLPLNIPNMISFKTVYDYFINGNGPWTSVGCEVIGIPGEYSIYDQPQIQFMVLPVGISTDGGTHLRYNFGIRKEIWDSYYKPLIGKQVISILPVLLHPKSRGYVELNPEDLNGQPIINPNYLSELEDVNVLIYGLKIIKEMIGTEPMRKLGAQLYDKPLEQCRNYVFDTKEYWECYIRHLTLTSYHPVGTCKMGGENDETAVVDYNFKVKGIENLYIADASVIPLLTSGNINAPIAMIGEKVAEVLKMNSCRILRKWKMSGLFFTWTCESV